MWCVLTGYEATRHANMARVRDARTTKGCHAAVVYKRATDCPTHDAWCHMREMRPETGSRSLAAALVTGTIVVVIADVPDVCGGAAGATILNGVAHVCVCV